MLVILILGIRPQQAQAAPRDQPSEKGIMSTEANLGVGWLLLPGARVCSSGGCRTTDSSFLFHLLGRVHASTHWTVGAGAHFGLWPTTSPPLSESAASSERSVSRSYLALTAQLLYFPWRRQALIPRRKQIDLYLGLDTGFALLSDRYDSPDFDEGGALHIGEQGAVVRSEGFIARGLVGADLGLTEVLALGLSAQAGPLWFPGSRATPFGDPATLEGVSFFSSLTVEIKAYLDI